MSAERASRTEGSSEGKVQHLWRGLGEWSPERLGSGSRARCHTLPTTPACLAERLLGCPE